MASFCQPNEPTLVPPYPELRTWNSKLPLVNQYLMGSPLLAVKHSNTLFLISAAGTWRPETVGQLANNSSSCMGSREFQEERKLVNHTWSDTLVFVSWKHSEKRVVNTWTQKISCDSTASGSDTENEKVPVSWSSSAHVFGKEKLGSGSSRESYSTGDAQTL